MGATSYGGGTITSNVGGTYPVIYAAVTQLLPKTSQISTVYGGVPVIIFKVIKHIQSYWQLISYCICKSILIFWSCNIS